VLLTANAPVAIPPIADPASETWNLIRNSTNPEDFDRFIAAFPESPLVATAKFRAGRLPAAPATATPVAIGPASPEGKTRRKINPKDGLAYAWIPPGKFMMGCSPEDTACKQDEKPVHEVTITRGFRLGETEVTQAAYLRVTGKSPSIFRGVDLPVDSPSWNDASFYCKAIGGRLPSEAEWEYAARGGASGARYGDVNAVAWYQGNSEATTHTVGEKQKNGFGLYDILGNVEEWVADWLDENYTNQRAVDPAGPSRGTHRALRGGSWVYPPELVRLSERDSDSPGFRGVASGVRCAAE
jgi:formylglycine-generating enzyme required for sulfatase activity